MSTLKFTEVHNLVAFLSKPTECERFEQNFDFMDANPIKYVLTVNPIVYTSCIEQFWATVKAQTVNGKGQLQALVDGKKVLITESTIRRDLQLEDAEGVDCLPNVVIFEQLTLIGAGHAAYTDRFHEFDRLVPYLVTLEIKRIARNVTIKKNLEKRGNVREPIKDRKGREDKKGLRPEMLLLRPVALRNVNPINARNLVARTCFECGHGNQGNQARGRAFMLGAEEARQDPNIITDIEPSDLVFSYEIEIASGQLIKIDKVIRGCKLEIKGHMFDINLIPFGSGSFDVIIGMDWLSGHKAEIICHEKVVMIRLLDGKVLRVLGEKPKEKMRQLMSAKAKEKTQEEIAVVRDFLDVFLDDLPGLLSVREIEFQIELVPGAILVARSPYRLAHSELEELLGQLKELRDKEKDEFNTDFHPMVDFIAASPLRRNLKLRDEDGIVSIPDTELFENLTLMGQYSRRARIAQSSALPTIADEPASPAQEEEILRLKERVQVLEDRDSVAAKHSKDDAPIKGRSINEGEAAAKRISNDSKEVARVLTSMDAATVLARGIDVPTGSGSIPTAGPPATVISTGSEVGPTASPIVTSCSRRKGKEVMVESDTPKNQRLQEQIDA
uniref:Reverse transcriptase domain-containing protein n=1 Tax=Tanacetum cinerariifolium TaxID=118510 RepID=A0A6L2M0Y6_TANCI|nr:hypothetical protein [Tanacetum cinerariifolium]